MSPRLKCINYYLNFHLSKRNVHTITWDGFLFHDKTYIENNAFKVKFFHIITSFIGVKQLSNTLNSDCYFIIDNRIVILTSDMRTNPYDYVFI